MAHENNRILEFENVTFRDPAGVIPGMREVNLHVRAGELFYILTESDGEELPFFDLAQGLEEASGGDVRFMETSWSDVPPRHRGAMRSRIGRVFAARGWISNLNVRDNIMLSQRYHTKRSESDLNREIAELAGIVNLDPKQESRPDGLRPSELRRYEWIRAFFGGPDLLLLQRPEAGVREASLPGLVQLVERALAYGAAVVWTSPRKTMLDKPPLEPTGCFRMDDDVMIPAMEDSNA